jgi:hypothetical protein
MVLIEYSNREFRDFIGYFGMIAYKEYLRWLERNKIEKGTKPYIRFKFYTRSDEPKAYERAVNKYEFKEKTIAVKEVEVKKSYKIDPKKEVPSKNIVIEAKKEAKEVKLKYKNLNQFNEEVSEVIITEKYTIESVMDIETNFFIEPSYDWKTEDNKETQVTEDIINEEYRKIKKEEQEKKRVERLKMLHDLEAVMRQRKEMMGEIKVNDPNMYVDDCGKKFVLLNEGPKKLRHQLDDLICYARSASPDPTGYDDDDEIQRHEIMKRQFSSDLKINNYEEGLYDSDVDSDDFIDE